MSYQALEESLSHVYELYKISREGNSWYYTSSDENITYDGNEYISVPIKRTNIDQSPELKRTNLTLTVPMDIGFIQEFIRTPPTSITTVTIFRGHFGDAEVLTVWLGRLSNVSFDAQKASLTIESIVSSLKRPTLRMKYNRNCPYDLYGRGCLVDKEDFVTNAVVTQVNSVTISAAIIGTKPANYFTGGMIVWDNGTFELARFIISHSGDTLELDLALTDFPVGTSISIYPGCNRTLSDCNTKFSNVANYGGQPFYPMKDPFSGDNIFF